MLSVYRLFIRRIYFHSTSDQETKDILSVFPDAQIFMIPNFLRISERLFLEPKKQILFMGRIHPIKSIHNFIDALSLSDKFLKSDFIFVLAGEHEERHENYFNDLKDQIAKLGLQEKIFFKGHVKGQEKEELYASSYVLVLPSETENFGNVVVEALNQGTPVIASLGTPWALLNEYECGYHVFNEPKALAEAIDKILDTNPTEYNAKCENAMRLVDNEFNVDNQINRWIIQYNDINAKK